MGTFESRRHVYVYVLIDVTMASESFDSRAFHNVPFFLPKGLISSAYFRASLTLQRFRATSV